MTTTAAATPSSPSAHPAGPVPATATAPPVLVATADPVLREALLRLAAAAGVAPLVVAEARAALAAWSRAALVVVGADLAADVAALAPARRPGVQVAGTGPVPDALFRAAVALGAEHVAELPASDAWLVELMTDAADPPGAAGLLVGVLGGSGGAGATTAACALAEVAAAPRRSGEQAGGPVLLVDLDPRGPGVDRVLGLERRDGVGWAELHRTTGRLSARALAEALPRARGVGVLGWPPGGPVEVQPFAAREALSAAVRGHGLVVVDLPRAPGGAAEEALLRCDRLLVVVVPTVAGVASAVRTCAALPDGVETGLLLRGRGDPESVARVVRRPVLGGLPEQRGLEEAVDLGLGPVRSRRGPLARAAREVLAALHASRAAGC